MMDDIIELIIDVAADVVGDTVFCKLTHRRNPVTKFLLGLVGAGAAGLACYAIVSLLIK